MPSQQAIFDLGLFVICVTKIVVILTGFVDFVLRFLRLRKGPRKPAGFIRAFVTAAIAGSALSYAIVFADYDPDRHAAETRVRFQNPARPVILVFLVFSLFIAPFLAGFARVFSVPRGYSDIGVGLGSGLLLTIEFISFGGVENLTMSLSH